MNESIQKAKALFAPVPHVQLGFFPTPFYKLENMSKALGVNLYIKRDDFTARQSSPTARHSRTTRWKPSPPAAAADWSRFCI